MGADQVIAVNLNGDLVERHFTQQELPENKPEELTPTVSIMERLVSEFPSGVKNGAFNMVSEILGKSSETPRYFDVLAGSINIMQDHITRSRMAGDPPDILLAPRLAQIGLLEFNRAKEAIEEGRRSVKQALPYLQK